MRRSPQVVAASLLATLGTAATLTTVVQGVWWFVEVGVVVLAVVAAGGLLDVLLGDGDGAVVADLDLVGDAVDGHVELVQDPLGVLVELEGELDAVSTLDRRDALHHGDGVGLLTDHDVVAAVGQRFGSGGAEGRQDREGRHHRDGDGQCLGTGTHLGALRGRGCGVHPGLRHPHHDP